MRSTFIAAALCAAAVFSSPAQAGTTTSQFRVTLTVQAECRLISSSDIAFGTSGVITSALTSSGNIQVQCTNTTPYNIGLNVGAGSGASDAGRRMTSGAGATLIYNLYRDSARTQVWGQTINSNTVSGTGNGAVQPHTVYGVVPVQTTPAAGNYSDTVQVILTY